MCVAAAVAVASFGLNAASDVMAAKAKNAAASANTTAANANQAQELNTLSLRGVQDENAATSDEQQAARKTQMDTALQNLGAAENGVSGHSVDALQGELQAQKGMYNDSVAENLNNQLTQITQDKAGVEARTQERINSVQKANPWATALKIGGSALATFSQIRGQQPAAGGDNVSASAAPPYIPMANTLSNAPTTAPMAQPVPLPALNLKIG